MKLGGGECSLNPKLRRNSLPIELIEGSEHEITNDGDIKRSFDDKEQ